MNNECGNTHTLSMNGRNYVCNRQRHHEGDHKEMQYGIWGWVPVAQWQQKSEPFQIKFLEYKPEEKQHSVQFSTHELAELYAILAANHEIPEVYLNKVAKALKAAL